MAIEDYFTRSLVVQSSAAASSGDMGGAGGSWTDGATVKGSLDRLSGSKSNLAAQFVESATHVFLCPASSAITAKNRLKDGATVYGVLYVDLPLNMSHHLEVILELLGA